MPDASITQHPWDGRLGLCGGTSGCATKVASAPNTAIPAISISLMSIGDAEFGIRA